VSGPVRWLVAIGGSWGGITALRSILTRLPPLPEVAVAVVLHRQAVRSQLAHVLGRGTAWRVVEVEDKAPLEAGTVHVAPPDYHLLVEPAWLSLSTDERVRFSRPSIDVMLESAAAAFGGHTVAVVLTGASDDGSDGVRAVRRYGGTVIVQDPQTAEQPVMPEAAIATGVADLVAPLDELPTAIEKTVGAAPTPGRDR
jgi:two-component system, chemotaxis family, protein-glutamate methylesterase/glutaminase